jgi:purine-binding chemotaxis protein CheW
VPRFEELLEEFFYRPDEDPGPLLDLPPAERLSTGSAEHDQLELLTFSLGRERYAVPVELVREIVRVPSLTELPNTAPDLLGVMSLRGEVLPVYEPKLRLGLSGLPPRLAGPDARPGEVGKAARVVVLHAPDGDAGLLVDQVSEVLRLRLDDLERPPPGVGGAQRPWVAGLARRGEGWVVLLDISQVLP